MFHTVDRNGAGCVVDVVENAIDPYTEAIICAPAKLFGVLWARIALQLVDVPADQTSLILG